MGQIKALLKKHAGWVIVIIIIVILCCVIYFWRDIKKYMGLDTGEHFQVVRANSTWSWNTEIRIQYTRKYTTRGLLLDNKKYIIKTYPEITALYTNLTAISPNIDMDPSTYSANMLYVLDFGIGKAQTAPIMYMPMTVENRGVSNEIFYKVYDPSNAITLKPAYIPSSKTEPNYYYMSYIYFNVTNAFHDTYVDIIRNIHTNIDMTYYNNPVVNKDNINKNIYKDYDLIENNGGKLYPLFFNENYIQVDVSESNIATAYKVLDTDNGSGEEDHSIHYNTKNGSIFPCWTYSNQYAKYYPSNFYKNWIFNYRFKDYMTIKFTRDLKIPVSGTVCVYISIFHDRIKYYLVNPSNTDDITFTTDTLLATTFKKIPYSTPDNPSKYITQDGTKILGVDAISSSYQAQLKLFKCNNLSYEPVEVELTAIAELNSKLALHNYKRPWFLFDSQTKIYMRNASFNDQNNTVIALDIPRSGGFTSLHGAGNYAPYLIIDTVAKTIKLDSALHKIPLGEKTTPTDQQTKVNSAVQFDIIPAKLDVGTFSTTYTIKDLYTFIQNSAIPVYGFIHPSSNPAYCKLISYPDYKPITLETAISVLNTTDNTIYKYDGQNTLTYSILSPDNCPNIKKLNGDTGFVISLNKFIIPDETLTDNYTTDDKTWTLTNKAIPATKLFKKYVKKDDSKIYIFGTTDNEYLEFDLATSGLKLAPVSTKINERFVNSADGQFIYYKNHVRFLIDSLDVNQYYLKNIPLETTIKPVAIFFTEFTPTTTTSSTTTTLPPTESSTTTTLSQDTPTMPTLTISPDMPTPTLTISPDMPTPTLTISPATSTIPVTTTTKYITTTTTPSPIDMGTYIPAAPGVISFPLIQ